MGENLQNPTSFSSDGKWLAYQDRDPITALDLWVAPLEGKQEPQSLLKTNANELEGEFSPDGRWMAYQSDESGRFEVYVLPFPGPGRKFQVSTDGGERPRWNPRGGEIFYHSPDNKMMVVDVTTSPAFSAGSPRVLFEGLRRFNSICCEVAPDGQRFLAIQPVEPPQPATQIHVVLNWFEELKRRVPAGQ
jgi:Tol biopolymer transport system component